MSEEEPRKSMDDVLSSIRRIMRPGQGGAPAAPARSASRAMEPQMGAGDDAPLSLDEPLPLTEMLDQSKLQAAPSMPKAPPMPEPEASEPARPEAASQPVEPVMPRAASPRHWSEDHATHDHAPQDHAPQDHAPQDHATRGEIVPPETAQTAQPDAPAAPEPGTSLAMQEPEGEKAMMVDEGALEDMIRRVVRAELVEGDIGKNISKNVQRLIQAEVAKALKNRW